MLSLRRLRQKPCRVDIVSPLIRSIVLGDGLEPICHYSDVIMGVMASQITSLTIVYSTVYSGADQRKHQSSASLAFVRGIHRCEFPACEGNSPLTGEFLAQRTSNAENVSIWWRHHAARASVGTVVTEVGIRVVAEPHWKLYRLSCMFRIFADCIPSSVTTILDLQIR